MEPNVLHVGVLYECEQQYTHSVDSDVTQGEAQIACRLLRMLRDMFHFRIVFHHYSELGSVRGDAATGSMYHDLANGSLDTYAGLLRVSRPLLDIASPLLLSHTQRLGFSLMETGVDTLRSFYSEPFRRPVWLCVFGTVLLGAWLLHALHVAEKRLGVLKGQHHAPFSLAYELLATVAACCQTSVPICTRLRSRRIAYGTFFFFALLLNTFYTSKVVSTLLRQRHKQHTLRMLADSNVLCLLLDSEADVFDTQYDAETEYFKSKKLEDSSVVSAETGVAQLRRGTYALFSDYISIYPEMVATFLPEEICATAEIDVFPAEGKYLWASKYSPFIEKFKVGLVLARERGELARALRRSLPPPARAGCPLAGAAHAHVRLAHLATALIVLAALYALALLILAVELLVERRRRPILPFLN